MQSLLKVQDAYSLGHKKSRKAAHNNVEATSRKKFVTR